MAYNVWISCIEPQGIEDGEVVVYVHTNFQRKIVTEHYAGKLQNAFEQVLGIPLGLKILSGEDTQADPIKTAGDPHNLYPPKDDKSEYSFENFVVGPSNKFAHAASQAVASKPAGYYNPLFIYGGSGLGKTHLLYAICNEIKKNSPDAQILYTKSEVITNELIESLRSNRPQEFRTKYRKADILLVDDIQFIAGKTGVQEEFFHTFEALHQANKQIVLASDRPPKEIATLEDRLRNRFEMGLLADIQPPDLETRIAIIKRKAQMLEMPISDDIAEYIANQLKSNVRQLEGAVKFMRAQCQLEGIQPSLTVAQSAIRDIRNDSQPAPVTVDRVITEVARTMNVSPEDIRSEKRSAPISQARQVASYVVRSVTNLSMKAIGEEFRHTGSFHYCICRTPGGGTDEKRHFLPQHGGRYYQKHRRLIRLRGVEKFRLAAEKIAFSFFSPLFHSLFTGCPPDFPVDSTGKGEKLSKRHLHFPRGSSLFTARSPKR